MFSEFICASLASELQPLCHISERVLPFVCLFISRRAFALLPSGGAYEHCAVGLCVQGLFGRAGAPAVFCAPPSLWLSPFSGQALGVGWGWGRAQHLPLVGAQQMAAVVTVVPLFFLSGLQSPHVEFVLCLPESSRTFEDECLIPFQGFPFLHRASAPAPRLPVSQAEAGAPPWGSRWPSRHCRLFWKPHHLVDPWAYSP